MIYMKKPRIIMAVLLAVLLLTGGVSITAMAATGTDSTTSESAVTADSDKGRGGDKKSATHVSKTSVAATVLGKTEAEMETALKDSTLGKLLTDAGKLSAFKTAYLAKYKAKIDAAVKAGTLTQAQADEKYTAKKTSITAWDGSTDLSLGHAKGDRTSDTSKAGKSGKSLRVDVIALTADLLGKTTDEVRDAVKDGKVGDLLIEAGKVEQFKTAYLAEVKTKLKAAVTAGTLTQAEADEKYATEKTKMAAYDGSTHLCGGKDHSKFGEKSTS
jgi:hypothetical protein